MDKTKAKIQSLCPDVMELKFECEIKLDKQAHTVLYYDKGGKSFDGENTEYYGAVLELYSDLGEFVKHSDEGEEDLKMPKLSEFEILGSPITLAVVLRAMERAKGITGYAIGQNGAFYFHGQELFKVPRWNLEHDYDQQSDECKQFIGSLLGV